MSWGGCYSGSWVALSAIAVSLADVAPPRHLGQSRSRRNVVDDRLDGTSFCYLREFDDRGAKHHLRGRAAWRAAGIANGRRSRCVGRHVGPEARAPGGCGPVLVVGCRRRGEARLLRCRRRARVPSYGRGGGEAWCGWRAPTVRRCSGTHVDGRLRHTTRW